MIRRAALRRSSVVHLRVVPKDAGFGRDLIGVTQPQNNQVVASLVVSDPEYSRPTPDTPTVRLRKALKPLVSPQTQARVGLTSSGYQPRAREKVVLRVLRSPDLFLSLVSRYRHQVEHRT